MNILVTGCGGDIGQSVGKILTASTLVSKAIGCDLNDDHAARFIYGNMIPVAACSSPQYIEDLSRIIKQYEIDFLLPISEPELRMLTEQKIEAEFLGTPVICANRKAREIGFDKLATARFLEATGLPFPESQLIGDMCSGKFPLILKSRKGSGSKSIFVLQDQNDFSFYKEKYPAFVAQELIADYPDEYTCGVYRSKSGLIRSIIYRRKLVDSYSGYGEVVENKTVTSLLHEIAVNLKLSGSINVQLKLSSKGPVVFEINPRFSSTVLFRHMMGFRDLEWSLEEAMGLPLSDYDPPKVGTKFYKGFQEYIC